VGAALDSADVVDEGVDVLGVFGGVLDGHFHSHAFALVGDVDNILVGRLARAVEILDEFQDTPLIVEGLAVAGPLVAEGDLHAAVEEGQLLEAAVEDAVVELGVREDQGVGLEGGLGAYPIGPPNPPHFPGGHAALVFLLIDVAAAADLDLTPLGEEVDHRHPHAVQPAGGLIGALVELAAEFEHRHHALKRRYAQIGVRLDGYAAAVVLDGN
jgi:hypothetical protein